MSRYIIMAITLSKDFRVSGHGRLHLSIQAGDNMQEVSHMDKLPQILRHRIDCKGLSRLAFREGGVCLFTCSDVRDSIVPSGKGQQCSLDLFISKCDQQNIRFIRNGRIIEDNKYLGIRGDGMRSVKPGEFKTADRIKCVDTGKNLNGYLVIANGTNFGYNVFARLACIDSFRLLPTKIGPSQLRRHTHLSQHYADRLGRLAHRLPANRKQIRRANYTTIEAIYHKRRKDAASAVLETATNNNLTFVDTSKAFDSTSNGTTVKSAEVCRLSSPLVRCIAQSYENAVTVFLDTKVHCRKYQLLQFIAALLLSSAMEKLVANDYKSDTTTCSDDSEGLTKPSLMDSECALMLVLYLLGVRYRTDRYMSPPAHPRAFSENAVEPRIPPKASLLTSHQKKLHPVARTLTGRSVKTDIAQTPTEVAGPEKYAHFGCERDGIFGNFLKITRMVGRLKIFTSRNRKLNFVFGQRQSEIDKLKRKGSSIVITLLRAGDSDMTLLSRKFGRVKALCTKEIDQTAAQIEITGRIQEIGYSVAGTSEVIRGLSNHSQRSKGVPEWRNVTISFGAVDRSSMVEKTRNCVYKIGCKECTRVDIRQTARELHTRIRQHKRRINKLPKNADEYEALVKESATAGHDLDRIENRSGVCRSLKTGTAFHTTAVDGRGVNQKAYRGYSIVRKIPGICSNVIAKASTESVFHSSVILQSFYEFHNGGRFPLNNIASSYHITTNNLVLSAFKHVPMKRSDFNLQESYTGQNNAVQKEQPIWEQKPDVAGLALCRCTWTSDMTGTFKTRSVSCELSGPVEFYWDSKPITNRSRILDGRELNSWTDRLDGFAGWPPNSSTKLQDEIPTDADIENACFEQTKQHLLTYYANDGHRSPQIDYAPTDCGSYRKVESIGASHPIEIQIQRYFYRSLKHFDSPSMKDLEPTQNAGGVERFIGDSNHQKGRENVMRKPSWQQPGSCGIQGVLWRYGLIDCLLWSVQKKNPNLIYRCHGY
ncbi:hypothetical protein CLF_106601 [Clonorchis sinensis]|uniref:C2H2-type domain-containing protein n=1 Tax=Clonorchis sinensis TaxID=79923 RepID=G7YQ29_CLOSI|nr:hypothetical protein CLF_106601 [Clonorchis sinensis]